MHAERKAIMLALFLGLFAWLVDACVHTYQPGASAAGILSALVPAQGRFLLTRVVTLALFLLFGHVTGRVLRQRRLAQTALRESRARAQQLFDNSPDALWELDPRGTVLRASHTMAELVGLPATELVGRPCSELLKSSLCRTARCPLQALGQDAAWEADELLVERPDERQALCLLNASALCDEAGRFTGLLEVYRNITEQRRSEARFEALVEATGDGVTIIDPTGVISYANAGFCHILGYAVSDVVGHKSTDFLSDGNREVLLRQLEARQGGMQGYYEMSFTARCGRKVPVLVTATPLFDENGDYTGSFAVMKDVTEQRLSDERTAHLNSVLLAIRNVNQLITREQDRDLLLQQACDCLTETRGYRFAMILLMDSEGMVRETFGAGDDLAQLQTELVALDLWRMFEADTTALEPHVLGETLAQAGPSLAAEWAEGRACLATRLQYGERAYGALVVSTPAAMAASKDEQSLFIEVTGDLAFALHALEAQAERTAAVDSLELTQFSVEHASDAIFWTDGEGKILYVNGAACGMLGYSGDTLQSMRLCEFDEHVDELGWPAIWERLRQRGTYSFETVQRAQDGKEIPVEITINYLNYKGREYSFSFGRDISRRKRAQAELQRLNAQYRMLVESQLVEIFILQKGLVVFANQTMHERMGYEPDGLLGLDPVALVVPEMQEAVLTWNRRREAGEPVPDAFETQVVTRTGAPRWVQVWAQEIHDFEGAEAIIGHIVDVTETRELRGQLEHSQRLEALGTLAGGVAHEFNNVLQAILMNASLLQMTQAPMDGDGEKLKTIVERSEYGARLTDQLLTFSRRAPVQYGPLNLNALLEETKRLLIQTIPRQIGISLQQHSDLWTIWGDGGRLKQVFINLALNARDAMPAGGELTFETQNVMLGGAALKTLQKLRPGPHVLIKIRDTGTGMDQQTISRAFEPFFTTKGVGRGTGLGLSIVHGIVDTHSGHVRISSQLGIGTTFHIYIPAQPELQAAPPPSRPTASPKGATERILVVDDEEDVVRGASEALSSFGYHVTAVHSGMAALKLVTEQPHAFDLVILDLVMPGLSGQQTLTRLREINSHLKVLIASGYMPQMEKDSLTIGASGYLDKPFAIDRLLDSVRGVLDQPPRG
jgi:two-component system, cell cycle sensor histidine kinase and response regulator CckA